MGINEDLYASDSVMGVIYMIEADDDIGEFMESEDGAMVNLFWSNTDGWVPFPVAEGFTKSEYFELDLPEGGHWVEVRRVLNFTASHDTFVTTDVSKVNRNPVVYPDDFDGEDNFRVI